jgi:hypothetical protein
VVAEKALFFHSVTMHRQASFVPLSTCWLRRLVAVLVVWLCTLTLSSLPIGPGSASASFPIPIRLLGKIYLAPSGDLGRHRDLLPLGLDDEQVIYLQVDSFHTPNKEQGELILFSDMQRYKPHLRVINGNILAALLTEEVLRGKKIAINGFLYRTTGLLLIAEAHLEE